MGIGRELGYCFAVTCPPWQKRLLHWVIGSPLAILGASTIPWLLHIIYWILDNNNHLSVWLNRLVYPVNNLHGNGPLSNQIA